MQAAADAEAQLKAGKLELEALSAELHQRNAEREEALSAREQELARQTAALGMRAQSFTSWEEELKAKESSLLQRSHQQQGAGPSAAKVQRPCPLVQAAV